MARWRAKRCSAFTNSTATLRNFAFPCQVKTGRTRLNPRPVTAGHSRFGSAPKSRTPRPKPNPPRKSRKASSRPVGRSYWFECSRCGYRAKVSGRADRGFNFAVQTIVCRDCRELLDAVTGLRVAEEYSWRLADRPLAAGMGLNPQSRPKPPTFMAALNRLPAVGATRFRWLQFRPACPVSPRHRIEPWN